MSTFKIAVLSIFSVAIVLGIGVFAFSRGSSDAQNSANLVVWGTLPKDVVDNAVSNSSIASNDLIQYTYVQKNVENFDRDFVEALAEGRGPDVVLIRGDFLYKHRNKLFQIPYANFPQRQFKDKFIENADTLLDIEGVLGIPFIVDPLVMYWNRDMFTNNLVAQVPVYWDEVLPIINKITKRDDNANVLESTIAFGEYRNISNAKEIVSMLLLQAGTPITSRTTRGVVSVLNSQFDYPVAPSQSALNFYTQFSNPTSPSYTWNRSLPSSINMFLSNNLAIYVGFASEATSIQQKNSNLNFDVAVVPQIRDSAKKTTFGHLHVASIVKQSRQVSGSFMFINAITEVNALKQVEKLTSLPPVRRDMLAQKPTDALRAVFYDSALISRSWIDPDSTSTANTFRDMIEAITGGRSRLSEALSRANEEITRSLQ